MSDALRKVQSGQPLAIPAAAYNAFVDAALDLRRRTAGIGQESRPSAPQPGVVLVRNDSGADRGRFEVLGVDAPVIDPAANEEAFKDRAALSCVAPAAGRHEGLFVVLAEPVAAGMMGRAFASGVCPVVLDAPEEDALLRSAEIADGVTASLAADPRGSAAILWRAGGAGLQWALVRLGAMGPGGVFPVVLAGVGGGPGGESSPADWTYDVADAATGAPLAAGVNPTAAPHRWRRPVTGPVSAADFGYAHVETSGGGVRALVVGWINETPELPEDEPGGGGEEEEAPPPCGHPGNEPGGGGDADHPADESGAGNEPEHPGDAEGDDGITPESSGDCT